MSDARNQSMTTMVEYQIRSESTSMEEWLDEWETRARDALDGEPETSAYAAARNLEDETNVLVFERYRKGDGSLKLHVAQAGGFVWLLPRLRSGAAQFPYTSQIDGWRSHLAGPESACPFCRKRWCLRPSTTLGLAHL